MWNSGITVKAVLDEVLSEADIAPEISAEILLYHYNECIQLIYGEIVKDEMGVSFSELKNSAYSLLPQITCYECDNDLVRGSDVLKVYVNGYQQTKASMISTAIFNDTYCELSDAQINCLIGLHLNPERAKSGTYTVTAVVVARPEITVIGSYGKVIIPLPYEFVSLVKAKLRGEAYKLANEDTLAAKWLNDYNNQLETFRLWVENKKARFGE